jgi:chromatin modification-related protein VID21
MYSNALHASTHWSEDDDICLISFIIQYSFNWDLICDALNSVRLPITGKKRTPWECHDRWKRNNLTSLSGQVSSVYTSKLKRELNRRPSTVYFDSPQKRQRQHFIAEAIKKTQKKREESEKQQTAAISAPPRSTIEVHGTNSAGQRLPSAMEMSLHKAQRERQMAQAVLEQRQLSAAISLGSQTPISTSRPASVPSQPSPQQQSKSSMSIAATAAATAVAAQARTATSAIANSPSPVTPNTARPPPVAQVTGSPMNRYPAAQLQLLRQQQMVLMAAAQQQAQQQAAAAATAGQARPPSPATMQRFANAIQASQQQQLQLQQAQSQAQAQAQAQSQAQIQAQAQVQAQTQAQTQAQAQLQAQQQAQLLAAQQQSSQQPSKYFI